MSGIDEARTAFSAAHYVYIPACILLGVVIGWLLGGRTARAEVDRLSGLLEQEEERQTVARLGKSDDSP